MPDPIRPRRSHVVGAVPTTSDLLDNELGINWPDGVFYTKHPTSGQVISIPTRSVPWVAAPASATASGTAGQVAYDASGYLYLCVATDTWVRYEGASWVTDLYFSSVYLLLHMEGTGSTFTDSSSSPKTVTVAGNVTQSTAQAKYGSKAAYFDGSGDYLTVPAPAFGTSNWVVEGWFYPTSSFGGTLFTARSSTAVVGGPTVVIDGSGLLSYYIASADNSTWQIAGSSSGISLTLNTWQHIAIVRSGNTLKAYKDGTGGNSVSISDGIGTNGALSLFAGSAAGGQEVAGYVDEFRITIGSDRGYTGSTITVPTAAFPDA